MRIMKVTWLCSMLREGHSHRGRAADRLVAVPVSPIYPALNNRGEKAVVSLPIPDRQ
jgi:hypothetical protein